ncbi:alpha/beta hydrolase [[Pseudomonas] carboxydohydrogena]|uniref:Palmitoyl-protein thioesterase ABHD10, mitochondrial n=1 Tax=Afipia carboxydohydrogena TaxID=290 RepID=A0ABY8BSR3_AFICR|nr:alpha/beta hydrolase [[Pseudomonas] carboxydohydrogena]WEF51690.1 alpha/beta hydrolase [[Pseudomonas] carboxydohydrogena]
MTLSVDSPPDFIDVRTPHGERRIAVRRREGRGPGLVWLGGFKSDMLGTKARELDAYAQARGRSCLRFDYSGHGESSGDFKDGTIGAWLEESLAVIGACCEGEQILIGSSMGGWMALLAARAMTAQKAKSRAKLKGLVLIAPAPDFTEDLMWERFTPQMREEIERNGVWYRPSDYGDPYPITKRLIEEGRDHLLLGSLLELGCPIRILQGVQDEDVPWQHAFKLTHILPSDDVVLTLVQDGDHRLSRPQDIARILAAVTELAEG